MLQGSASEAMLVVLPAAKARTLDGRAPEDMLNLVVYGTGKGQAASWNCYYATCASWAGVTALPPADHSCQH